MEAGQIFEVEKTNVAVRKKTSGQVKQMFKEVVKNRDLYLKDGYKNRWFYTI